MSPAYQPAGHTTSPGQPDVIVSARELFKIDTDLQVPAFSSPEEHVPAARSGLRLRPGHDAGAARRVRAQPARDGAGPARHRQVEPRRAGRLPAQLALRPRQPRWPCEPHGSHRQGRHRRARREAGHRVPAGNADVGAAAPVRPRVRRVRRRPGRRDVRDPARARSRGTADAARSEPRHRAASLVPAVRDRQHRRPGRCQRALPRHAAAQSGPDGSLEHRRDAELPGARSRDRRRAGTMPRVPERRGPRPGQRDGGAGQSDPARLRAMAICRR